jgi:hypothetical protein
MKKLIPVAAVMSALLLNGCLDYSSLQDSLQDGLAEMLGGNVRSYKDADGNSVKIRSDAKKGDIKLVYDKKGNLIETGEMKNGVQINGTKYKYDKKGRIIEIRFEDENKKPVIGKAAGYAINRREFDSNGNLLEDSYYRSEKRLMYNTNEGYAKAVMEYDKNGNQTEISYYNQDEKLAQYFRKGTSIIKANYDNNSNLLETSYFGLDKKHENIYDGYAIHRSRYDAFDRGIEDVFFEANGNLAIPKKSNWAVRFISYNENGDIAEELKLGENQLNILPKDKEGKVPKAGYYEWYRENVKMLRTAIASDAPKILNAISNSQYAYGRELDRFISCKANKYKGNTVRGDGWNELGFDAKPYSNYFTFEVKAIGKGFAAIATLNEKLGDASAGSTITIDEKGNKTVSDPELQKLVPDWKSEPKAINMDIASSALKILNTISSSQNDYMKSSEKFIACRVTTTTMIPVAATEGDGWNELGIKQRPSSRYFTFEVRATKEGFTAIATLKEKLGDAPAGSTITIDEKGNKKVSNPELQVLVPGWKSEPKED